MHLLVKSTKKIFYIVDRQNHRYDMCSTCLYKYEREEEIVVCLPVIDNFRIHFSFFFPTRKTKQSKSFDRRKRKILKWMICFVLFALWHIEKKSLSKHKRFLNYLFGPCSLYVNVSQTDYFIIEIICVWEKKL